MLCFFAYIQQFNWFPIFVCKCVEQIYLMSTDKRCPITDITITAGSIIIYKQDPWFCDITRSPLIVLDLTVICSLAKV